MAGLRQARQALRSLVRSKTAVPSEKRKEVILEQIKKGLENKAKLEKKAGPSVTPSRKQAELLLKQAKTLVLKRAKARGVKLTHMEFLHQLDEVMGKVTRSNQKSKPFKK